MRSILLQTVSHDFTMNMCEFPKKFPMVSPPYWSTRQWQDPNLQARSFRKACKICTSKPSASMAKMCTSFGGRSASSKRMAGDLQSTWISKIYGLNSWQWAQGWISPCSFDLWYLIDRLQQRVISCHFQKCYLMSHNYNLCGPGFELLATYVSTFSITRNYMELYYSYQLLPILLQLLCLPPSNGSYWSHPTSDQLTKQPVSSSSVRPKCTWCFNTWSLSMEFSCHIAQWNAFRG